MFIHIIFPQNQPKCCLKNVSRDTSPLKYNSKGNYCWVRSNAKAMSANNRVVSKQECTQLYIKMAINGHFYIQFIHFRLDTTRFGSTYKPSSRLIIRLQSSNINLYVQNKINKYITPTSTIRTRTSLWVTTTSHWSTTITTIIITYINIQNHESCSYESSTILLCFENQTCFLKRVFKHYFRWTISCVKPVSACHIGLDKEWASGKYFSYFSTKTYVVGIH